VKRDADQENAVGGPGRSGAVARAVRVEALCRRGVQAAAVDGAGVSMSVSSGAPHPVASRWPAFLDEALAAGIRAVFAFPVGHGATPVGTLDLYRRAPGPLVSERLRGALLTADVVGLALVADEDTLDEDDDDRGWFHMEVHRAAGMVMVQTGGTIEEALLVMRASAYGEGISVNDLAAEVVSGRRRYTKEQM
jgi:hypothetical protein